MNAAEQPVKFQPQMHYGASDVPTAEDLARADMYGLLASLFHAAPSPALLQSMRAARANGDGVLERAWSQLCDAAQMHTAAAIADEYDALFISVGKPEVLLYGSYYLSGFLMEKPLAALRSDLAALGLRRDDALAESEDHIAVLCEVMRHLILRDAGAADAALAMESPPLDALRVQKAFFATHIQPWTADMCEAIANHAQARFYAALARFAQSFFEVEMQAFDME